MTWNFKKEYKKVDRKDLEFLMNSLGMDRVYVTDEIKEYFSDHDLCGISTLPEVVVEAVNREEISEITAYAQQQNIPIAVREVGVKSIEYSDIVCGGIMINFSTINKVS
ncbi:FAD-dependent oxidoreductase [Clostridium sp. CX1]|uniref:FAD-dependent oxidoreductase n=1 Tax=Clostridium tanneri TaxID=3037988 RepID=A0ABU4JQD8_9CLOT|nr:MULTISPECIES: FAD-dependent oxidoreductase [unclassified Clostridium]MCT8977665.1 FAD-dependent oxidoreductase [Clostridium sp. CX1]MDW8800372.1 FAD-dependent oxidoreductase [Clostridium sp. A1-XYC3]